MTAEAVKKFNFDGDPRDPDYWWEILSLHHQGYDPNDDGFISVPVNQLEELQQSYVRALCALEDVAAIDTASDLARRTLNSLGSM